MEGEDWYSEYALRDFINIATRWEIEGIYRKRTENRPFSIFTNDINKARENFDLFCSQLNKRLTDTLNWKAIEIDLKDRFLPMINRYLEWYDKNKAETEKFEPHNPYKMMLSVIESTQQEILKYFPEYEQDLERLKQGYGKMRFESLKSKFAETYPIVNADIIKSELKPINQFISEAEKLEIKDAFVLRRAFDNNPNIQLRPVAFFDPKVKEYEYLRLKHGFYLKNYCSDNPGSIPGWVYGEYFLFKEWLEQELIKHDSPFEDKLPYHSEEELWLLNLNTVNKSYDHFNNVLFNEMPYKDYLNCFDLNSPEPKHPKFLKNQGINFVYFLSMIEDRKVNDKIALDRFGLKHYRNRKKDAKPDQVFVNQVRIILKK